MHVTGGLITDSTKGAITALSGLHDILRQQKVDRIDEITKCKETEKKLGEDKVNGRQEAEWTDTVLLKSVLINIKGQ